MWVERATDGSETLFIIRELAPRYHQTALHLSFTEVDGAFVKRYPTASPHLERSFGHFAQVAEAMIHQAAGEQDAPWQETLEALLVRIEPASLDWFLCGSAALAARGIAVTPHDVDLTVGASDAQRLGEILMDGLVQPVEDTSGWICQWFGRAFCGARIEWVGGVLPVIDEPEPSDFGPAAAAQLETISWRGHSLRVPPLHLQLATSIKRGLLQRADQIRQAMA